MSVAVVLAGLIVGTAPGVTKSAFLSWQTWNPLAQSGPLVSVDYMWNQTYGPLHWPKKRTVVLQMTSPKEMYWKSATLDTFLIDHWQFSQQGTLVGSSTGGTLSVPPATLPLEETVGHNIVTVKVKVLGLADNHLVGADQPVSWTLPGGTESLLDANGTVTTLSDPARNASYSVKVYDPSPTIAAADQGRHRLPRRDPHRRAGRQCEHPGVAVAKAPAGTRRSAPSSCRPCSTPGWRRTRTRRITSTRPCSRSSTISAPTRSGTTSPRT